MSDRVHPRRAIDLPSWLAYLHAPVLPYLKRFRVRQGGPRDYDARDILVPEGYAVELLAGGFNTPVACCFDDQGHAYVVEGGHKIDARPRVLKVDLQTGAHETWFTLPTERWTKTGSVTGACWHQ